MRITDNVLIDVVAGVSLALVLPTNYRITDSIGIGEIGLATCALAGLIVGLRRQSNHEAAISTKMATVLVTYTIAILLPTTLVFTILDLQGTSIRDWLAYLFSFSFVLSLAVRRARISIIIVCFVAVLIPILFYQFFLGGDSAWYSLRFTGGARNPNQLALYIVCAIALAWGGIRRPYFRWAACAVLFLFGLRTLSDAYLAYIVTVFFVFLASLALPRKSFFTGFVPVALVLIGGILILGPYMVEVFSGQWDAADEGGARVLLYKHGLQAWLSSPYTILLGNGAGSFSGLDEPFQISEAHNTIIDTLAMGGVIGVVVFFYFPIRVALGLYRIDWISMYSLFVGIIALSLFHFVVRHPIFWFTIFAVSVMADNRIRGSAS